MKGSPQLQRRFVFWRFWDDEVVAKDSSSVKLNPLEPTRQGMCASDSKSREMEVSKPVRPQKVKGES